ncbi:MAG: hypothetical protein HOK67_04035 [Deltaproteobacteria bacterium]|jgi:benzoyl-CoA reductase/2-hydroxyglutaryl-CoA dehydratase subunit BcrC/BadD/HgdB|nr:hypothetical protein [Deltaproteobacteria bacterium]
MKLFTRNKLSRKKQGQNKNHKAFIKLCDLDFDPPAARSALIAMNKIRVKHLAQDAEVTAPTIYQTCYGIRRNKTAQTILSQALGIPVPLLFPDTYKENAND